MHLTESSPTIVVKHRFQLQQFPDLVCACAADGDEAKEGNKMNRYGVKQCRAGGIVICFIFYFLV